MIIDVQHHAMPLNVYTQFHDPKEPPMKYRANGNDFTFNAGLCDFDRHIRDMDEAGVDISLLSMSQFGNLMGKDICRQLNDGFKEVADRYPGRFAIAGCFPQDDVPAALAEIDHQINDLGFPGITMLTSFNQEINLSNEEYSFPIYEKAMELNIPIFLHPHLRPFGVDELDCSIAESLGREVDCARAVLRLIYDVLPKFPDLKFIIPHFGGATLATMGRMRAFFVPKNTEGLDVKPIDPMKKSLAKTPLENAELGYDKVFNSLFEKLYFDGSGSGGWPGMTEHAFNVVRHDRILWATDYPFEIHAGRDLKYYIDSVNSMDYPEEDKKAFLGDNAAELLGLA